MKLESKIVNLLAKDAEEKFTINEISKKLNEYYSFVHRTVNKLHKEGVIIKIKAGKSYLCSLNLENEKTLALIKLGEIEKKEEFYNANKELKLILDDFVESALKQHGVAAIVLFGSYAKGQETGESDVDMLIITKRKIDIDKTAKEIYAKYGKDISPILMSPNDFKKQKDKAVLKEIIANHYVLYGAENFVNMVFEK